MAVAVVVMIIMVDALVVLAVVVNVVRGLPLARVPTCLFIHSFIHSFIFYLGRRIGMARRRDHD